MKLIDTHTHLYVEAFDEDRDQVIEKAIAVGVERFYLPAIDSTYTARMLDLEKKYPDQIRLMMGLHPTHVKENYKEELLHVEQFLAKRNFAAVGEIGIDLYWDQSLLKQQQEAFNIQILWAKEKELPIVIHCRDAFDEVFEVLEGHKGDDLTGIFHCFTGTKEQAEKAIGLNLKLGIGGVLTFKNGKIDQFLDQISTDHIVLETDAPYLAPAPFRGKRNQSEYLVYILRKLSEIHHRTEEELATITTQNALDVFKI
ncbi:MAG: TatD family hydrolase [Flavobacteriaceae bacterium]|jgi:TatD DNase family protein|nr:TatD family hydrolase [Flavobacteriaceae bacterium]MBT6127210.1 TatD family hydrolase [Flavobacteriaceae bacterium]MDG1028928.1 TatD family hydrolase [Flavobacteriaceae bacterium]